MTDIDQINEQLRRISDAAAQVAVAMQQIADALCKAIPAMLDVIVDALHTGRNLQKRPRYLPVRYIGVEYRRTDRRLPVRHIRNALPNMRRDRQLKRKGEVY